MRTLTDANRIRSLLSRGLTDGTVISLQLGWPLLLLPIFVVNQLLTPHPVWTVLIITLVGLYSLGYWWLRELCGAVELVRTQQGAILVAGDTFAEEFTLHNRSRLPIIWAEVEDRSSLPRYDGSRVVSVSSVSHARWRVEVECESRGVYRVGPATVRLSDPFGLFQLSVEASQTENLLIYPRVVKLPHMVTLRGHASGSDRRRQNLLGVIPAASVRDYQRGDSLRYIHWPSSAHRGELIVKELEQEPAGDVWVVLDLNEHMHRGVGENSTLEYSITVAASAAAELLGEAEQRSVGLLTVSTSDDGGPDAIRVSPQAGGAQLWRIMAALAPVRTTEVGLDQLLNTNSSTLGRRRSVIVVTPHMSGDAGHPDAVDWLPTILRLQTAGLTCGVLLIVQDQDLAAAVATRTLLARLDVPCEILSVSAKLPPVVTYRRTRKVLRTTPTGGVVVHEIEEEVG